MQWCADLALPVTPCRTSLEKGINTGHNLTFLGVTL